MFRDDMFRDLVRPTDIERIRFGSGLNAIGGVSNVGHGLVDARSRQCLFPMIGWHSKWRC
jgi:hypothetical protein